MQHHHLKKANSIFIFGFAVMATFYFGASFLIPLTFAAFLATLMEPLASVLEKAGMKKIPASFLCTLAVFIIVGGLSFLLLYQVRIFADDIPELKNELQTFFQDIQHWFSSTTGVSLQEQQAIIKSQSESFLNTLENQLKRLLENILTTTFLFLLVLVYLFLLLLNREKFINFVLMYVPEEKHSKARNIFNKTGSVIHHYLAGRIKVMIILAAMYLVTFLIFDVRYTLLLTIFGALITIIPYIGPFISGILPVCFVIIFGRDLSEVLLFSGIILVIQLIESYILEPVIIGSEVKLSPLAVIIAIIIGNMVWGISGMILFVPLFAMLKILSDNIPPLKPIGYLIGNSSESSGRGIGDKIKKLFKKS